MNTIPMHVVFGSLALLIVCGGIGCASVPLTDDIPVVKGFEAARYMGTWHEIARLPKWYERDMIHVSAEYSLDGDTLRIKNSGWRDNEMRTATIPAERRDALVKMASDWGFDVSKLEYPE